MKKTGVLKFEMPAQGWRQFLTARKEMLDKFDKARTFSKQHIVETSHGNVAEAEFRGWLKKFLPKKYAVTSGYIISAGVPDIEKTPHFDVIIYDQLNSPILWTEENSDHSAEGCSRAIPAEYVKGVIEVKSSFEKKSVKSGIDHLCELKNLMSGIDSADERYKMYLPPDFFCSLVFYELREEKKFDVEALDNIINGMLLRNFYGGIILRGEGRSILDSGKVSLFTSYGEMKCTIQKPEISLLNSWPYSDSVKIDNKNIGAMLLWNEMNFSGFAFDIVALLNGTYDVRRISSFHALGTTQMAEAKKSATKK